MTDIVGCLKQDLDGFEAQITDLHGQQDVLSKQIDEIETQIRNIEPIRAYAASLLKRSEEAAAAKAKPSASKSGAPNPLT